MSCRDRSPRSVISRLSATGQGRLACGSSYDSALAIREAEEGAALIDVLSPAFGLEST